MKEKEIQIGGQAVIEGVMMRGPEQIATALRRRDGSIEVKVQPFVTVTKTHPIWKLPVIRGFVSLIEMLKIGISTLNYSATRWEEDHQAIDNGQLTVDTDAGETKSSTESAYKQKSYHKVENQSSEKSVSTVSCQLSTTSSMGFGEILTIAFSLILAFVLFGYVPYLLAQLVHLEKQHILFNLFAGSIRIVFFVLYVWIISFMKDIRKVFEYHGAEHKSVFAHEKGIELTIDNVRPFTTIHPRCGTSFMFLVLLIAILIFSIIDTIVAYYLGYAPQHYIRLLYHLPFIPLISGISYEILKLSGKKDRNILVRFFTAPGMALQHITTREPDDQQIEVAITALKAAVGN